MFPTSSSFNQFKCFDLSEIEILATHYKIDEVLKKEWCSFHFELKEIKTKWVEFKQNVESNWLKLKTTATVWSLSYIANSFIESEGFHHIYRIAKLALFQSVMHGLKEDPAVSNRLKQNREVPSKWTFSMLY